MAIKDIAIEIDEIANSKSRGINSDIAEILELKRDFIIEAREAGKSNANIAKTLQEKFEKQMTKITKADEVYYPSNTWEYNKKLDKKIVTSTEMVQFVGTPVITATQVSKIK